MKLDKITKRIQALEPDIAAIEARAHSEFLSKLTDEELDKLHDACVRTQEWTLPTTADEQQFLDMLRAKYAIS